MQLAEYETFLSDVESKLDRLKVLYEQWFQGMERLEPSIPRKDVDRRFVTLRKELPRNTALRFRFHMLIQRYTTLQTYWQRVGRQIEEGTYRRDLLRTRKARLDARAGVMERAPAELDLDIDVDAIEETSEPPPPGTRPPLPSAPLPPPPLTPVAPTGPRAISPFARRAAPATGAVAKLDEPSTGTPAASAPTTTFTRPVAPPRETSREPPIPPSQAVRSLPPPMRVSAPPPEPPTTTFVKPATTTTFSRPRDAGRPAPASPPPAPPSPETDVRGVYDRYVEARRKNNEPAVAYETVAKSIKEMREKLRDKYAGKSVDFEVVVRDGKVGLKPVPK